MTRATSATAPLRVDYLPVDAVRLRGRIGLTFAPGKRDHRWERDLDADVERLVHVWRTNVLVSLLEEDERTMLGIARLPEVVEQTPMRLLRLAIRDGGVPASVEAVRGLVKEVLGAVARGKNVVVHCRGGLGRAGLVSSCCLVALGAEAKAAIEIVRAARPEAVENSEPEAFIERVAAAD